VRSIYFDFETSDRYCIGQLLNYCFIVVDENFVLQEECAGTVALTPLQVPSLGALLANRIRILDHCVEKIPAMRSEREAALHIYSFIMRLTKQEKFALIGFNSFKFDVPFLRTVLIRNGLNPYFNSNLVYRDLYPAVQYLACTNESFPRTTNQKGEFSLSLEAVTRHLNLLEGAQSHESRADVVLEIDLARVLSQKFSLNIVSWDAYMAGFAHSLPRGTLVHQLKPGREENKLRLKPLMLLDCDKRNSLWVDLERYSEKKPALTLGKIKGGQLLVAPYTKIADSKHAETENTRDLALTEYNQENSYMNLQRYFLRKSECDIEQDIYRLEFEDLDRLHAALHDRGLDSVNQDRIIRKSDSKDLKVLWARAKLATSQPDNPGYTQLLQMYGKYRYGGGQLLLSRYNHNPSFATSRSELLADVLKPLENPEDEEIRNQLSQFYRTSAVLSF